jgi:hypothetical protein
MFYDLTEPVKFLQDINAILEDDGILVLQLSYTPLMLIQGELGNLTQEHAAYHNLKSVISCARRANLEIVDIQLNNVNGGSMRVFLAKERARLQQTRADKDVARIRVASLLGWEQQYSIKSAFLDFFADMKRRKQWLLDFLSSAKADGKRTWGYGASTKGNTVLQWMGIGPDLIEKIADRQERKWGLVCAGSNIPVCSEAEMRAAKPDYLVVFPWHFIQEFKERETEYLKGGGKMIVLSPQIEIHSA